MTTFQRVIKYCAVAFAIFLIVSIIGGICGALGMVSGFFNRDVTGETKTYTVSSEINSLDVEIGAAALEINTGDKLLVESNHKYLDVKEKNGVLHISEEKLNWGSSSGNVKVVITVPAGFVFEEASISAGAGKVDIDTLSANSLDIDLGAGKADINCLNSKNNSNISNGTGKLTIKDGKLNNLSMDIGVGQSEMECQLTGNCSIDYGIGAANLTLLGKKDDYKIEIDKGVGNATLDGKSMSDDSVYGGGENKIDIDGGVGSIQIDFKEK